MVQKAVLGNSLQEPPAIASFRHGYSVCDRPDAFPQHARNPPISENDMVAANISLFPSGIRNQINPSLSQQTLTPSASLREWASGPSSQCSRSSSPADRFARLPVNLHSTDQHDSDRTASHISSPSKSHVSSLTRSTRNVDGEPYHPLGRDYPMSSSAGAPEVATDLQSPGVVEREQIANATGEVFFLIAGSMWSPGSISGAGQKYHSPTSRVEVCPRQMAIQVPPHLYGLNLCM